jgi:hypothetical protein
MGTAVVRSEVEEALAEREAGAVETAEEARSEAAEREAVADTVAVRGMGTEEGTRGPELGTEAREETEAAAGMG